MERADAFLIRRSYQNTMEIKGFENTGGVPFHGTGAPGLIRAATRVVFSPRSFFRELSEKNGCWKPMFFILITSALFGLLAGLYNLERFPLQAFTSFSNAFLMPFLTAIILYLMNLVLCPSRFTYRDLFAITAYANVTLLVGWIPGMSWFTGLWRFYLIGLGMVERGRISGWRSFASVLGAVFIMLALIRLCQTLFSG